MLQTDSGEYVPVWDKLQVSCDTFHMLEKSDVRDLCVVLLLVKDMHERKLFFEEKYIAVPELDPER